MIARPLMFAFALAALAPVAHAGELSKEECVQAYNRGWDAKEQFKLTTKVARVAKRLSVSPKKVRRILARAGKRKK